MKSYLKILFFYCAFVPNIYFIFEHVCTFSVLDIGATPPSYYALPLLPDCGIGNVVPSCSGDTKCIDGISDYTCVCQDILKVVTV